MADPRTRHRRSDRAERRGAARPRRRGAARPRRRAARRSVRPAWWRIAGSGSRLLRLLDPCARNRLVLHRHAADHTVDHDAPANHALILRAADTPTRQRLARCLSAITRSTYPRVPFHSTWLFGTWKHSSLVASQELVWFFGSGVTFFILLVILLLSVVSSQN